MEKSYLQKLKPVATTTPASGYQSKLKPIQQPEQKPFKYDVEDTREEKLARYKQEDAVMAEEARKANSFGGLFKETIKGVGRSLVPSEVGLGKTIASVFGSGKNLKTLSEADTTVTTAMVNTMRRIKEKEAKGEDTRNDKRYYNQLVDNRQELLKQIDENSFNKSTLKVAGELGGTALDLLTAGTYGKATAGMASFSRGKVLPTIAKTVLKPVGAFTKRGMSRILGNAGVGYGFDVTLGLQGERGENRTGVKALIPGLGTLIGGGVSALSESTQSVKNAFSPEIKQQKVVTQNAKNLQTLDDSYTTLRKVTEKYKSQGINVLDDMANTDLLVNSVDNTGTIRTKDAIERLNETIAPAESVVRNSLEKEGRKLPVSYVRQQLEKAIKNSNLEGESLDLALNKAEKEINGLMKRVDADEYLTLAKIHDAKVNKYATVDYLNLSSKKADKIIAKTYKEIVETFSKSIDVQDTNKELQRFYAMQNLLEKLDGKKVKGGKLGKYFAQTLGGMVGSHFGPLGTIIGAEAGNLAQGKIMSRTFAGKTGKMPVRSEVLERTIESSKPNPTIILGDQSSSKLGNLQNNQAPTNINIKNPIDPNNNIKNSAFGAVAGVEKDEEGNWTYNSEKGAMGVLGVGALFQRSNKNQPSINANIIPNKAIDNTKYTPKSKLFKALENEKSRQGGYVSINGKTIKQIDELTKQEIWDTYKYLDEGRQVTKSGEQVLNALAGKFNINLDQPIPKIKKRLLDLLDKTDTKTVIPTKSYTQSMRKDALVKLAKDFDSKEEFLTAFTKTEFRNKHKDLISGMQIGEASQAWNTSKGIGYEAPKKIEKVTKKAPTTGEIQKAKQYKTFDDYVKSQKVYTHQTNAKFDEFDLKFAHKDDPAVWFFDGKPQKSDANFKYTMERYPKDDIKLIPESKIDDMFEEAGSTPLYEFLEKKGYDGIDYGDGTIQIFNPKKSLRNKTELEEVWNKANTSKVIPLRGEAGKFAGSKSATKTDDLTSSIQKAKASGQSFDEWVKGQGDMIYHGSAWLDDVKKMDIEKSGHGSFSFTESEDLANNFAMKNKGKLFVIDKSKLKLKQLKSWKELKDIEGYNASTDYMSKEARGKFLKTGYDGVIFPNMEAVGSDAKEIRIFRNLKPEEIITNQKTRSQLKAEWDKVTSNKKNLGTLLRPIKKPKMSVDTELTQALANPDPYAFHRKQLQKGEVLVKDKKGNIGAIPADEFDATIYEKL